LTIERADIRRTGQGGERSKKKGGTGKPAQFMEPRLMARKTLKKKRRGKKQ